MNLFTKLKTLPKKEFIRDQNFNIKNTCKVVQIFNFDFEEEIFDEVGFEIEVERDEEHLNLEMESTLNVDVFKPNRPNVNPFPTNMPADIVADLNFDNYMNYENKKVCCGEYPDRRPC